MSANFSLETIDYCKMSPAAVACPRYEDAPALGGPGGDNIYANPTNTGKDELKRSRLTEYATLRESKLDERHYTRIKVQNEGTDDSEGVHKKKTKNYFMWALCCVVIYITVTFVITSALLAYTMWNVAELKKACCRDFSSGVGENCNCT